MSQKFLIGLVLGAIAVTAAGAYAGYQYFDGGTYAEVISVKPITKTIKTPRQDCHDEQVTQQKPVKDEHRVAGTVVGALVGGVLGNQVGSGNGRKVATVAGAAAGGYAGNQIQDQMQKGDTYTTTQQRCVTAYDSEEKQEGYKVTYRLNGKVAVVHMDHDPGKRIPVRDGKIVPDSSAERQSS
jgi:uncharacterized protein YcfJ